MTKHDIRDKWKDRREDVPAKALPCQGTGGESMIAVCQVLFHWISKERVEHSWRESVRDKAAVSSRDYSH